MFIQKNGVRLWAYGQDAPARKALDEYLYDTWKIRVALLIIANVVGILMLPWIGVERWSWTAVISVVLADSIILPIMRRQRRKIRERVKELQAEDRILEIPMDFENRFYQLVEYTLLPANLESMLINFRPFYDKFVEWMDEYYAAETTYERRRWIEADTQYAFLEIKEGVYYPERLEREELPQDD